MNKEALIKTIETKRATYFSRSRKELWIKGETSGNFQEVLEIKFDCDGDAVLLKIKQTGGACHTGQKSCFHNEL
jgi:phosphoribosyl-AMP cyclohydrolase